MKFDTHVFKNKNMIEAIRMASAQSAKSVLNKNRIKTPDAFCAFGLLM